MAGIVVNGAPRDLAGVPLHTNALDFLRASAEFWAAMLGQSLRKLFAEVAP